MVLGGARSAVCATADRSGQRARKRPLRTQRRTPNLIGSIVVDHQVDPVYVPYWVNGDEAAIRNVMRKAAAREPPSGARTQAILYR